MSAKIARTQARRKAMRSTLHKAIDDSSKYKHLCNLDLAESFDNALEVPVGVLIGIDQYHDFFTNKVCKGEYDGPVASETVLGWVLSGKVKAKVVGGESFCFHAMRCVVEDKTDDLKESLERFWEVENIGGRDCVVHQFESDISHNGKRYEVSCFLNLIMMHSPIIL